MLRSHAIVLEDYREGTGTISSYNLEANMLKCYHNLARTALPQEGSHLSACVVGGGSQCIIACGGGLSLSRFQYDFDQHGRQFFNIYKTYIWL